MSGRVVFSAPVPRPSTLRRTASQIGMTPERIEEMCVAVSELATNAIVDAQPPASVRAYADGVCPREVRDAGPDLLDPVRRLPATTPLSADPGPPTRSCDLRVTCVAVLDGDNRGALIKLSRDPSVASRDRRSIEASEGGHSRESETRKTQAPGFFR